ncbi:fibronectin-binding protein A N-terminus-domain-containing protein [Boeremia exigua]|uniref:fibronectin-binding protein A N-terminus-domain-containing protein n=1 Tax=Boeremia exigua TaxID=749465 RepID=UPI001E8EDEFA|nr:fibronectin-binding protein A N-terminus-domain-containing protein [Boeremia exigua]KAH6643564.1 fibronectin-binding protein A N-terminus-domain-containing protein [Boeremia exigua]
MKQRFSSLDVKVIAHELSKALTSLRVTNVYDLSSRIFLIKFHKPDHREQLLIDSGFRCHLTDYARTTAAAPSGFVAKLRKYLKTRRVTSVSQIGTDRILEFQFSDGLYRLYLEFYAGGNIVLTDGDLNILALLRNVEEGEEHEKLRVGLQYNLSLRQNYAGVPELTQERIRQGLQKAVDRQQAQPEAAGKKAKKAGKDALRKALATSITELPPLLVDHALHVAHYDSTLKPEQVLADESLLEKLLAVLQDALRMTKEITEPDQVKGYILAKPNPAVSTTEEGSEKSRHMYDDFHPFRPAQFENADLEFLEFDTFGKAVDEFFSSIEGQKLESKLQEREAHAKKKLEKARKEHEERIGGLQKAQELDFRKAEAILANVHRVTEATEAINGLITQGMDWVDIGRLIEREQSAGNAVAQLIKLPLKLQENTITLLLDENTWSEGQDEADEGEETSSVSEDSDDESADVKKKPTPIKVAAQPKLAIDIDLGLSPWANSTEYFDSKKTAASKEERTLQASERALKSHEKKVAEDLKKGLKQEKEVLRPVRKQHWFEKYIYFISSDGYMVLGGKDAQQNEIIYRKYLRKGDVYVHSDLKGSIPMIIKNNPNTPDAPIPPSTLSQAGNLSVCTSEAWDSKAVMSAWWVLADGVTKTGQTGEFLAPGVFNIKGKKEYLPPAQLIVGLGVMFEISEDSKARHHKHRVQGGVLAPTTAEAEAELAQEKEAAQPNADADSDDDAFPDAKMASDSEEEFPDAKMDNSDESDAESDAEAPANPLQSKTADQKADSEDEDEDDTSPQSEPAATGSDNDVAKPQEKNKTEDKSGIRHLSARERRMLRKGQLPDATPGSAATEENEDDGHSAGDESKPATRAPGTVTSQATKNSSAPLPRGKRGKAKKLATKYAAQDEEDRALAMRLLGSKSGQAAAEDAAAEARKKEEEALANKQRRREQHQRAQEKGKAAEDARRAALDHDDDADDADALRANLLNLDAFTGRPLPGDTILSAIPVAAPWAALASYKYKAKIQPGSTKRGKAVKEVLSIWDNAGKDAKVLDKLSQDVERIWPREIELIRGWKEPEVVSVLPVAKVRVMIAGGRRGAAAAAKGKKSARGGEGEQEERM